MTVQGEGRARPRVAAVLLGALLIIAGIGLLAAQVYGIDVRFDLARYGWPMFVILPGLVLLVLGLATSGQPGVGLAVAGSIVTVVGLVLSYQWATDHWTSWAYAWALIAPTAVGVGMLLWGVLHLDRRVARSGLGGVAVGLVLFLVFFGFFEGLLGIGDERALAQYGRTALALALIVGGGLIIVARLWPRRPGRRSAPSERAAQPPTVYEQPPPVYKHPPSASEQPPVAASGEQFEDTPADRPAGWPDDDERGVRPQV